MANLARFPIVNIYAPNMDDHGWYSEQLSKMEKQKATYLICMGVWNNPLIGK